MASPLCDFDEKNSCFIVKVYLKKAKHQNRIRLDEKFCISLSKCFCQVEGDCSLNSRYDRINFLANSLSPRHPRQKHLLTVKGLAAYKEIKGQ